MEGCKVEIGLIHTRLGFNLAQYFVCSQGKGTRRCEILSFGAGGRALCSDRIMLELELSDEVKTHKQVLLGQN